MSTDPVPGARGLRMFEVVQAYADLGDHRTGSEVDHRTAEWFARLLRDRGLDVEVRPVPIDHWQATSRLTADGIEVAHLPLTGEWVGEIDTSDVAVVPFDPASGGVPAVVDAPIAEARASGAAAAVLVTRHPQGSLVGINRRLDAPGSGLPVVLVAGRDGERLAGESLRLTMHAEVRPGQTFNLIARTAARAAAPGPLLLTTPLNGWFRCAGERGTGIAVLLDLLDQLADLDVLVVATGGHELGYLGAHRLLREGLPDVAAVLHVGASVAVEHDVDGARSLIPTRVALTSLGPDAAAPLASALTDAELTLATEVTRWLGEGDAWSQLGRPLLSVTGAGIDFHTPDDLPARVTSPDALERVADALARAARHLMALAADHPTDPRREPR